MKAPDFLFIQIYKDLDINALQKAEIILLGYLSIDRVTAGNI